MGSSPVFKSVRVSGGPEQLAAQGRRHDKGRYRAAAQTSDHARDSRHPELPVPVQLLIRGQLKAGRNS